MARILIVDDARIMRNILSFMLEKAGHEVVGEASDGAQALKLYGELRPDLVTMDIQMEGGDGITYLKEIVHLDPDAKIIMVSAQGHDQVKEEARGCGAVGYIAKPFQKAALLEEIQSALGN